MDSKPPGSSVHGLLQNTRAGCHLFLQGSFRLRVEHASLLSPALLADGFFTAGPPGTVIRPVQSQVGWTPQGPEDKTWLYRGCSLEPLLTLTTTFLFQSLSWVFCYTSQKTPSMVFLLLSIFLLRWVLGGQTISTLENWRERKSKSEKSF